MKRYLFLALIFPFFIGCDKMEGPVDLQETMLPLQEKAVDEISFAITHDTKAPIPITSLSSFYVTATTSSGSGEVSQFDNVSFSDSGSGLFVGGKMWPASNPYYHFYASNVQISNTSSGQSIIIDSNIDTFNKDIVCAYISSSTYKQTNQLQFNHILARVGTVTLNDMDNYSDINLTLKYRNKGTFNLKSGLWTDTGSDQIISLSVSDNNLWIIPGDYCLTLDFKDAAGEQRSFTVSKSFVAGKINNITASCKSSSVIIGYDDPIVELSYPNSPIAYNSTSGINPSLTVKQRVYFADETSEERILSSNEYSVTYQAPFVTGLGLNTASGCVTPESNIGPIIEARTEYSDIAINWFSYSDIVYLGASSSPTLLYEQIKTTYSAGRGCTSDRSFVVSANVIANGKSSSGSCEVMQNGDQGQSVSSISENLTTGAAVAYSGTANGFSLGNTGIVTAEPNIGIEQGITYSSPVVSVSPDNKNFDYRGESQVFGVSYSQIKTVESRNSTSNRSIAVSVTVSMNGKNCSSSAICTQLGDPGETNFSETITSGGVLSYAISNDLRRAFSNVDNIVTASSNESQKMERYGSITISTFRYPDVNAGGGTSIPIITANQTLSVMSTITMKRTATFTVTVDLNGKTGSSSVGLSQDGDSSGSSYIRTLTLADMSVSFVNADNNPGASLDPTTGIVTWETNVSSLERTRRVKLTVTSGGVSANKTVTSKQLGASGGDSWDVGDGGGESGGGEGGNF